MNNKTLAIVSYITIIGWLIAYFMGKEKADNFLKYHLRQSFGVMIASVVLNVVLNIVVKIVPALSFLGLVGLVILVLWIIGILNALKGESKPLPLIGEWSNKTFTFIK